MKSRQHSGRRKAIKGSRHHFRLTVVSSLTPSTQLVAFFIFEFDYEEDFTYADDISIFLSVDVVNQFMALAFKSFSVVVLGKVMDAKGA
jgi:hypothetical protein